MAGTRHAVELKKPDKTLYVTCKDGLTSPKAANATPDDTFTMALAYDTTYAGHTLPAGTEIDGQILKHRESRFLGHAGYVDWKILGVRYPDGHSLLFQDESRPSPHEIRIHHPKSYTSKTMARGAWPFTVVGVADTIILGAATNLSNLAIMPISVGARMALGSIMETTRKPKPDETDDRSFMHKAGYGAWRGTGLPGLYKFVKRSPEAACDPGQPFRIRLSEPTAMAVFEASDGDIPTE
jgi:hypothetical protein